MFWILALNALKLNASINPCLLILHYHDNQFITLYRPLFGSTSGCKRSHAQSVLNMVIKLANIIRTFKR